MPVNADVSTSIGAILDGGCARRHWARAGRDEETALRSNKETEPKKIRKHRAGTRLNQKRDRGVHRFPIRLRRPKPEADK
jgi:hypothetical protein